jgi:DNA-binding transcriptional MerR regulator
MLINEVARIAGMSKDGVRHYEEMGLIGSRPRRAGSRTYRDYDPAVLETIEQVRQAQRLGFSLKEIGPLLKAYGTANLTAEETVPREAGGAAPGGGFYLLEARSLSTHGADRTVLTGAALKPAQYVRATGCRSFRRCLAVTTASWRQVDG